MTQRQARIAAMIAALPEDPDTWEDADLYAYQAARSLAVDDTSRLERAAARKQEARQNRPAPERPPWSTNADLVRAKRIVRQRAGGRCERCGVRARDVHHVSGRGWDGCHHPSLLVLLCGTGNTDGCHGFAHSGRRDELVRAGLKYPWGTTVADAAVAGWIVRAA